MKNLIGVMQGRLLPKYKGRYQAFPKHTWQEEFKIASDFGLDCIEFIFDYEDYEKNPLIKNPKLILEISKKYQVSVFTVCADYFMESKLTDSYDVLKQLVDNCSLIGVTDIVLPIIEKFSLRGCDKKKYVNILQNISDYNKSINFSLETDLPPKEFASLLSDISRENVTVNYDIGNSASLGYDYKEELKTYGNKISDVHIKDRVFGGGPVVLGTGSADISGVIDMLTSMNYNGPYIMQSYRDDDIKTFTKQLKWIHENCFNNIG